MAMETTSNTRTLRAYVTNLLRYPRWVIEREVDFTDCPYDGNFNAFLPDCVNCQFGRGCRWLDQQRSPDIADAPLDELIEALGDAVEYLQSIDPEERVNDAETIAWLREARRFMNSRQD